MIFYFAISTSLLVAYLSEVSKNKNKYISYYYLFIVILILSLLSGLRLKYNDTERYIYNFNHFFIKTHITLGDYPGFYYFQYFLKYFIYDNAHFFIFLSSLIINFLVILFYYVYSRNFLFAIFLYIFSGFFLLGMAAIKQMIAIAIGIWGIHFFYKKNYYMFVIVILFASLFHFFSIIYFSALLFYKNTWDKKTILLLIITIVLSFSFSFFINITTEILSTVKQYNINYILNQSSVNPFRVLFYSIVPILSFFYRKKINEYHNEFLNISINFSILAFLLFLISLSGAAIMFGRLASYFEIFIHLSIIYLIYEVIPKKYRITITLIIIFMYSFFFYYQFFVVKNFHYSYLNLEII